jgi:uncharacterized membrane protein YecN with MAPEG domain
MRGLITLTRGDKREASMTTILLPVTLTTASVLTLLCICLIVWVGMGRGKYKVSIGDGGHADLTTRMRTHANFVEYVPLLLILMGLLELAGANNMVLSLFGAALVLFRILHAVGMPRPAPNPCRAIGAAGSMLLLLIGAVYGLIITWYAWSPVAF